VSFWLPILARKQKIRAGFYAHADQNVCIVVNQLRRCCDCNYPIGNRDRFCPRCGVRQPREKIFN